MNVTLEVIQHKLVLARGVRGPQLSVFNVFASSTRVFVSVSAANCINIPFFLNFEVDTQLPFFIEVVVDQATYPRVFAVTDCGLDWT